ncbi:MAG: hypothetical protein F6K22_14100 [Okeania sp. SIO2F4]|uniref:hypothetical protein n=1 Tax=Okeania sp. SIO2F4 TaxID=2607790 RepID=UPI00142A98DE|nr:hypothetical protein [Okeania sp. SIO2F4]NES03873.1 hypothetical protein [Okeania sp. SIO2F4]
MAEVDEEFNLKDWEWIEVPFPPSEREGMAKVAWFICCKCTPEEIYQRKIDPRIVIPLCGIVLLDEIDLSQLKILKNSRENTIEYYISSLMFKHISRSGQNQEDINRLIDSMNPSKKWKSLFETLDVKLQLSLVYRLLTFRRPTRDDWRNIFLYVEPGYLKVGFVLLIQFLMLLTLMLLTLKLIESATLLAYFLIPLFEFVGLVMLISFVFQINIEHKATNPLKHIFKSDSF